MTIQSGRIDVHHHLIPPAFISAMERHGIREVAGAPLPRWKIEDTIAIMDVCSTQTAILSLSAPGVYFGDIEEAVALARRCNEFSALLTEQHPGRIGYFAVLPMPFTQYACAEAIHALDNLNAAGIVLLGSTEGKFLGDPQFDELMAELDRRKTVVFVHPNLHETSKNIGLDIPGFLMEFLCDTTRAALNLVLSGTMERYPNIRWILAHAGGFLPYIAWRLSLANMMAPYNTTAPQGVLTYIKRFYFDTALSPSPYALGALRELVEPSHILFGSDFPFAPAIASGMQVKALQANTQFDEKTRYGINRGHALSLFPQYKSGNEVVTALPVYGPESLGNRVRRMLIKPVVTLADHIRGK